MTLVLQSPRGLVVSLPFNPGAFGVFTVSSNKQLLISSYARRPAVETGGRHPAVETGGRNWNAAADFRSRGSPYPALQSRGGAVITPLAFVSGKTGTLGGLGGVPVHCSYEVREPAGSVRVSFSKQLRLAHVSDACAVHLPHMQVAHTFHYLLFQWSP